MQEDSFDLYKDYNVENPETILPIVRKCLTVPQNEAEVLRALEIALCFCLRNFSSNELEEKLFQMACPAAKNFVLSKLKHLEKNPEAYFEYLSVVLKVITYFQGVFEYLSDIKNPSFIEVKSLLMATCEILYSCYSHCKISEEVYGSHFNAATECLSNFFKNCCSLQEQQLDFLTEKSECDVEDDRELLLLNEIMTYLSKSGIILIYLEVKTMAKVWKSFALLIQKYFSFLKNNYYIGETIRDLNCCIMHYMEVVLYREGEDTCKIIKLSCFLLKLVIKFSEMFKGCLKNCQQSLLDLLLFLCRYDAALVDKLKDRESTGQNDVYQLTVGIDPLLSQLMADEELVKKCHLLSEDSQKSAEFCFLCCFILKKLLESSAAIRSLWFNDNENILQWIFLSASSSRFITCSNIRLPNILINGEHKRLRGLYEHAFVTTSAFLMTANADEYRLAEKTLIENVLQRHPIRALLAIDFWCLLARFADSELCLSQILTLGKVLEGFSPGTSTPEKWYLSSLIRRLFPLLSDRHKEIFLKSFKPRFYSALWQGSTTKSLKYNEVTNIYDSLLSEVELLSGQNEPEFSAPQKVRPVGRESVMYEMFGERIARLWKFNCEVLSSTRLRMRFLKTVCLVTASVVSDFRADVLFLILSQMKTLLTIGQPTCVKLYFTWILTSLSSLSIQASPHQKKILLTIADIFRDLLSSKEVLAKEKALETFRSFSHLTSHGELVSLSVHNSPELKLEVANYFKRQLPEQQDLNLDDYFDKLYQLKFQHVCQENEEEDGAFALKKTKSSVEMEEVVVRWREDAERLVGSFKVLSDSQKEEIKNLCSCILALP